MAALSTLPKMEEITAAIGGRGAAVVDAIRKASAKTGVDFSYLMSKASQESGFKADAKASTSSATGLYQFIDQTWLDMVKNHGAAYGLGGVAAKIAIRDDGSAVVSDPTLRQQILDLRKDPTLSAAMAGELAKENKSYLEDKLGGKVGGTELSLAHFLGANGAATFLRALRSNSSLHAAELLPAAACANRNVFFDKQTGQPLTVAEVYKNFSSKINSTGTTIADKQGTVALPVATAEKEKACQATFFQAEKSAEPKPPDSLFAVLMLSQLGNPDGEVDKTQSGYQAYSSSLRRGFSGI